MDVVFCLCFVGLLDEQCWVYIIVDNKFVENVGWDEEFLKFELGELCDFGFELDVIGFD